MSRTDTTLYCVNFEGTIHSILIGSERATLLSKTRLDSAFVHLPFIDMSSSLIIKGITTTPTNELFVETGIGFIRCACGTLVNCYRRDSPGMLNIVPDYNKTDLPGTYATDGRVLAVRLNNLSEGRYPIIRLIDLLSPFDRTEVSDIVLKETMPMESLAIDSTAFKGDGALFVYFANTGLRVYRYRSQCRIDVDAQGPQCKVRVVSSNMLGSSSEFTINIQTIQPRYVCLTVPLGILLCIFGFGTIIFLVRRYHTRAARQRATAKQGVWVDDSPGGSSKSDSSPPMSPAGRNRKKINSNALVEEEKR